MKKYEYHVITVTTLNNDKYIETALTEEGKEGWEIVSMVPTTVNGSTLMLKAVFKREI